MTNRIAGALALADHVLDLTAAFAVRVLESENFGLVLSFLLIYGLGVLTGIEIERAV